MKLYRLRSARGYILVATLLILSLATVLVTGILYRVLGVVPFIRSTLDREKGLIIIDAGAAHIQGLLTFIPDIEKQIGNKGKSDSKQEAHVDPLKTIVTRIFPYLNRWTEFDLKEPIDGMDGQLSLYLACEDGKININQFYDFEQKKFVAQQNQTAPAAALIKKACKLLEAEYKVSGLFEEMEKFFKTYNNGPLNDISELLLIPGFEIFQNALFVDLQTSSDSPIVLTDLFTVATDYATLKPWFFSKALQKFCSIKEKVINFEKNNQLLQKWIKDFSQFIPEWQGEWKKVLQERYQREYQKLPSEIVSFFDSYGVPQFFMVICVGQINNTSVSGVYFIEVIESSENNQVSYQSRIKKMYLL